MNWIDRGLEWIVQRNIEEFGKAVFFRKLAELIYEYYDL
jgi:hypothetical protein